MKIKYKPWAKGLMYLVEAVVIILSVFPILWVIMSSFVALQKNKKQIENRTEK